MARLKTLPPRIAKAPSRQVATTSTRERRMTGRRLQDRRWRMWQKDPHCAVCRRVVEYPHGFELDHIVPLVSGGADEESNCQVLCCGPDGCHLIKTGRDLGAQADKAARFPEWIGPAAGELTVVFGPPGSGKTTWVEERARASDLVIDVDRIVSRISGLPMYQGAEDWMESALRVRNTMLSALSRNNRRCYFITTGPTKARREWWAKKLKPTTVVVLSPGEKECIDRVEADERRPKESVRRSVEGIREWYSLKENVEAVWPPGGV